MDLKRRVKLMGKFLREDIHPLKAQLHLQFFSQDTNKDGLNCDSSYLINFHFVSFPWMNSVLLQNQGFQHKCVLFYALYQVLPEIDSKKCMFSWIFFLAFTEKGWTMRKIGLQAIYPSYLLSSHACHDNDFSSMGFHFGIKVQSFNYLNPNCVIIM